MITYVRRLLLLATGLAVILGSIQMFVGIRSWLHFAWWSLLFFSLLSAITGWVGKQALRKTGYMLVASVTASVFVKLLCSAVFVALYVVIVRPSSVSFVIPFFFMYILFTVFELRQLTFAQQAHENGTKRNDYNT